MNVQNLKLTTLKAAMAGTVLVAGLVTALVMVPAPATAAAAPTIERTPEQIKNLKATISKLTGNVKVTETDKIKIIAPAIAEVGSEVGIKVRTKGLENVQSITLLAPKNTTPLVASFGIPEGTHGNIKSRVKLREAMNVIALVKAGGKFYTTSKFVKITKGGCGG